jgi:hypothetical protein
MEATAASPALNASAEDIKKPPRQRSNSYPAYTIDACIVFTQKVDTAFSSVGFTPQEAISQTLDQSGGAFLTIVSSCVQYGLLDKSTGNGYKPSDRFKKISRPLPHENIDDFKLECFAAPKLYKELIEVYADKQLPAEAGLANTLHRLYGVLGNASTIAAKIFYKNAKALKVLDDGNFLRLGGYIPFEEDKRPDDAAAAAEEKSKQTVLLPQVNDNTPPPPPPQLPPPSYREIPIFLKGKGEAKLVLPQDFDNSDLKRIVKVLKAYYEEDAE